MGPYGRRQQRKPYMGAILWTLMRAPWLWILEVFLWSCKRTTVTHFVPLAIRDVRCCACWVGACISKCVCPCVCSVLSMCMCMCVYPNVGVRYILYVHKCLEFYITYTSVVPYDTQLRSRHLLMYGTGNMLQSIRISLNSLARACALTNKVHVRRTYFSSYFKLAMVSDLIKN